MEYHMGLESYRKQLESICADRKNDAAFYYLNDGKIEEMTYGAIFDCCQSFEKVVRKYGLQSGDRIAVASCNSLRSRIFVFAVYYWGITVVLPDITLPAETIRAQIAQCESRLILSDRRFYRKKLQQTEITVLDIEAENFDEIYDSGECKTFADRYPDVFAINFSSGTGGLGKPVMITAESLLIGNRLNSKQGRLTKKDTFLLVFPIYHIAGLASMFTFFFCAKAIYTVEKYEVEKTASYLRLFKPTVFAMIPKVTETLLDRMESEVKIHGGLSRAYYHASGKISEFFIRRFHIYAVGKALFRPFYTKVFGKNIRAIISGAMRSPLSLAMKIRKMGLVWYNSYSSTECGCPIVATGEDNDYGQSSEGRIDWCNEVQVIIAEKDASGVGEVCVKTPMIMKGYFHMKEMTDAAFDENGYFRTGDLAYVDEQKHLHLQGRSTERIHLRNGEKTAPEMLEQIWKDGCPENNPVTVCKFGSVDNAYDEIVAVFRDLSYSEKDKMEIKERFLFYVGRHCPLPVKQVRFVKNIPTTALGKVKRSLLAEMPDQTEKTGNTEKVENSENLPETVFDFFIRLADVYLGSDTSVRYAERLSDTGLDSLAVFTIAEKIREKFGTDIIPYLKTGMTMQELQQAVSHPFDDGGAENVRKIRKDEVRAVADMYAECMKDYPLYKTLYPDDRKRKYQLRYDAWFVMYQQMNYTYINEDKTALFSIKMPGDRNRSMIGLHLNPAYLLGAMRWFSPAGIRRVGAYLKFEESIRSKYYNPATDLYICNVCIAKEKRSGNLFFQLLKQFESNNKFYFETHSDEDLKLYLMLGAHLLETSEWNGMPYYALSDEKHKQEKRTETGKKEIR